MNGGCVGGAGFGDQLCSAAHDFAASDTNAALLYCTTDRLCGKISVYFGLDRLQTEHKGTFYVEREREREK